jgi:hypothetical protein
MFGGPRSSELNPQPTPYADTSDVAQGKPVARRGRKARDLPETARLPTATDHAQLRLRLEVLGCTKQL